VLLKHPIDDLDLATVCVSQIFATMYLLDLKSASHTLIEIILLIE